MLAERSDVTEEVVRLEGHLGALATALGDRGPVGKRSDDRRGVPEGTPQEGGASTPLAAPGSFAAAAMITRTAS